MLGCGNSGRGGVAAEFDAVDLRARGVAAEFAAVDLWARGLAAEFAAVDLWARGLAAEFGVVVEVLPVLTSTGMACRGYRLRSKRARIRNLDASVLSSFCRGEDSSLWG